MTYHEPFFQYPVPSSKLGTFAVTFDGRKLSKRWYYHDPHSPTVVENAELAELRNAERSRAECRKEV